jgi:hypothetical protein
VPVWGRIRRHLTGFAESIVQWLTAGKAPTAAYVSPPQRPHTYPEAGQNVFGRAARLGMAVAPHAPLTPTERYAVRYAQQHAGSKLRTMFTGLNDRLETALLEQERQAIQQQVPVAILQRQGPDALASALAHVQETFLRDWRRVARTELVEAHGQGAVASLIARHPSQAGADTPEIPQILVYKITSVNSCAHCRRIWIGADGAPRLYPLSEVLANGTNEGRKAEDWRAVPGPIHPNCTEGALLEYTPAVEQVFDRMRQEHAIRTP